MGNERLLIVGGAHDGKWHDLSSQVSELILPEPQCAPRSVYGWTTASETKAARMARYRRLRHWLGAREFQVLVPKEMTDDEAGKLVFSRIAGLWAVFLQGK